MSTPDKFSKWMLVIGPATVVLTGLALIHDLYPLHINSHTGFGQDPAYQYLFSGVDILQGNAPVHTDHPGTPLQSLIAALIVICWMLFSATGVTRVGLFEAVLDKPEYFLLSTSLVLLALTGYVLYRLGLQIYRFTASRALAFGCQTTPLLYPMTVPNIVFPTPEALLISVSLALVTVLAPLVLSNHNVNPSSRKSIAMWAGILCGLGLAIKVTFAPLFSLLFLIRSPSLILRAFLFSLLAWLCGVVPILSRLGDMFRWFFKVISHSGMHGQGSTTMLSWAQLKGSIGWLIGHFGIFYYVIFCIVGLTVIVVLFYVVTKPLSRIQNTPEWLKIFTSNCKINSHRLLISAVFIFAAIAHTMMVAKHLGPSYMVPILSVTPLAFAWLVNHFVVMPGGRHVKALACWTWFFAVTFIAYSSLVQSIQTISQDHARGVDSQNQVIARLQKYDEPLVIGAFNCNLLNCARWFGVSLVPAMELRMSSIDPNFWYFNIFNQQFHAPGKGGLDKDIAVDAISEEIKKDRPVILISPSYPHLASIQKELLLSTPVQNLYRVTGLK